MTFLERQRSTQIGNLDSADAYDALERPLIDVGRAHDPAIFPILINAADGYPLRDPACRREDMASGSSWELVA